MRPQHHLPSFSALARREVFLWYRTQPSGWMKRQCGTSWIDTQIVRGDYSPFGMDSGPDPEGAERVHLESSGFSLYKKLRPDFVCTVFNAPYTVPPTSGHSVVTVMGRPFAFHFFCLNALRQMETLLHPCLVLPSQTVCQWVALILAVLVCSMTVKQKTPLCQ